MARIGVNALRLSGQRLGIGRYLEYLLRHWNTMLAADERVILYVREPFDARSLGLSNAFEVRELPSRLGGMPWESLVLARRWRETDVLFCPSYTIPLGYRGRTVVATHSVNEAQPGAQSWTYHLTYRPRNQLCARKADAVIVPSRTTQADVEGVYGVPAERISIVREGVDDSFGPVEDEQVLSQTRRRFFGEDRPYLLFVGKLSQRRNIPALLEAFAALKREDRIPHGLLLYGPNVLELPLDRTVADLGIADSVVQINERLAEHRAIMPVYSAADLFVHPTMAEGASNTIVEAMACGAPVVTVGRGGVGEIVDGSAFTVPESTPERLVAAMRQALGDAALRSSIREKALERSKRFRLSETARGTLEVLRRTAA
jgi:glycosyltransferase involved in cell wall biosynthesis